MQQALLIIFIDYPARLIPRTRFYFVTRKIYVRKADMEMSNDYEQAE